MILVAFSLGVLKFGKQSLISSLSNSFKSSSFSNLSNNSFYTTITLNWRLVGTQEQIKESNFKSVKLASTNMKAILTYLPNYLQFYKY
jgi:hypothetical protein